jgi:hypothetical protein
MTPIPKKKYKDAEDILNQCLPNEYLIAVLSNALELEDVISEDKAWRISKRLKKLQLNDD